VTIKRLIYGILITCLLAYNVALFSRTQIAITTAKVVSPSTEMHDAQLLIAGSNIPVVASPSAQSIYLQVGGSRISGSQSIRETINKDYGLAAMYRQSTLFVLGLLSFLLLQLVSKSVQEAAPFLFFVLSPVVVIGSATHVCRTCYGGRSDWLALGMCLIVSAIGGLILARGAIVDKKVFQGISSVAFLLLIGQMVLVLFDPRFCPICLFLGCFLQTILLLSERGISTGELTGMAFKDTRPIWTTLGISVLAGGLTWAQSPPTATALALPTLPAIQKALRSVSLHDNEVLLLTRDGCEPCNDAKNWIQANRLDVRIIPEGHAKAKAEWDSNEPMVTPTFVYVVHGKIVDATVGLPQIPFIQNELKNQILATREATR